MTTYTFLQEFDNIGQMPNSFNMATANRAVEPTGHVHDISLAAALKPLSIGSAAFIVACPHFVLKRKVDFHLLRLGNLQKKIQQQIADPRKANQKAKYMQQAKFAQQAFQIHHEYFTKILYWKHRSALFNLDVVNKLNSQYQRKLFLLNQNMQRINLGVPVANTSNY